MGKTTLSINDSVEVVVLQDGKRTPCKSSVFDIDGGVYQLHWPTHEGVRFPVHQNQQVNLVYFRDDAVYTVKGTVVTLQSAPVPTIMFRPTGAIERIQRREYCRVPASLPVQLVEAPPQKPPANGPFRGITITTRTIDISGSGMCIHLGFAVPAGTMFQVKLELEPGESPVDLTARAVYSVKLPPMNGRSLYRIGIEFTAVSEPKRRQIVRQVFKFQQGSLSDSPTESHTQP